MSQQDQQKFAQKLQDSMMPCPRCGTQHIHGPYYDWQERGEVVCAPEDVVCECGLELEVVVPLVKINQMGWFYGARNINKRPLRQRGEA